MFAPFSKSRKLPLRAQVEPPSSTCDAENKEGKAGFHCPLVVVSGSGKACQCFVFPRCSDQKVFHPSRNSLSGSNREPRARIVIPSKFASTRRPDFKRYRHGKLPTLPARLLWL